MQTCDFGEKFRLIGYDNHENKIVRLIEEIDEIFPIIAKKKLYTRWYVFDRTNYNFSEVCFDETHYFLRTF